MGAIIGCIIRGLGVSEKGGESSKMNQKILKELVSCSKPCHFLKLEMKLSYPEGRLTNKRSESQKQAIHTHWETIKKQTNITGTNMVVPSGKGLDWEGP